MVKMVKEINKKLVESIASTSEKFQCNIFIRSDSFYEVVSNGKTDYYTKDLETAKLVAKVIVVYYLLLEKCNNIFSNNKLSEEQKWYDLLKTLKSEYNKSEIDKHIAFNILETLEKAYDDAISEENVEKEILGTRNVIRAKDNLMTTIKTIAAIKNPKEAEQNFSRYKRLRNPFVQENPQFRLDLLS